MSEAAPPVVEGRSLWELVERRAAATPASLLAIDERGRSMRFDEFADRAAAVAAGLAARGVADGTVVAWQLPTWIESMVLGAALARLGACQVPLIPSYRAREVGFILRQAGADLVVVPTHWRGVDYPGLVSAAGEGSVRAVLALDPDDRTLPEGDPSTLPPPPAAGDGEDPPVRWLYYTSGTTASPKGARHTDATLLGAVPGMIALLEPTAADRNSMVFPFAHIGGMLWLLTGLVIGSTHLLAESFDPATTIPMLARHGVTLAGTGTPFNLAYLRAQRELAARRPGARLFPEVRLFMSGAAPKPPSLHAELLAECGAGIVSSYGMTEAPILTSCGPQAPDDRRARTEGRAGPGVDLRVTDADGSPLPAGEEGEVRVRGPQVCRGYVDPALDAEAFDGAGYLRTGDLGMLDADGYLTITGRLKDVIIRNGENISAKEIEDLLFLHPRIRDAAVVGLADRQTGERACAVVVLDDPALPLGLGDVTDFLRASDLMVQKLPEQLEVVDELPRNPAGKVLKADLRARFAGEREA
ncbi:MAG: class I adenylate-forming enzyme family protein [Acidimicrobiales bacterium]